MDLKLRNTFSALQSLNTGVSQIKSGQSTVIFFKEVQSEKLWEPRNLSPFGKIILLRELQCEKANGSIYSILLGKTTS